MPSVILDGALLCISSQYQDKDRIKAIAGARWNAERRMWILPATSTAIAALLAAFPDVQLDAGARALIPQPVSADSFPSKTAPWAHQRTAFQRLAPLIGAMLAHDMGTGKTMTALALLTYWRAHRVLVLCPKSVATIWPAQVERHAIEPWYVELFTDGGSCAKRAARLRKLVALDTRVMAIVNYEAAIQPAMRAALIDASWDAMVMDESQHIKAPGGVTSRLCSALADRAPHRLALTGTPMPHSPLDIYAQFRALDKGVLGSSFVRFRSQYAIMGGYQGRQVIGYQRQDELHQRLSTIMHVVRKRDVLDLPPCIVTERVFELDMEERRVYDALRREFVAWLKDGQQVTAQNALVKLLRLQQCTSGVVTDDLGHAIRIGVSKREALREYLQDLPLDEPVVIFTRFWADLDAALEVCDNEGIPRKELSGRVNEFADWREGALCCMIQAGAEGLDMSRAAYGCYYSWGFSLGQYEQSKARLDRVGQMRPVTLTHLIADHSIDAHVLKVLSQRREVVEDILRCGLDE